MKYTPKVAALMMLPLLTLAKTYETPQKIETVCKEAIAKKGYGEYTYNYVEILRVHTGSYDMSGQLHKGGKRYDFNCLLNKDAKHPKIEDLVINPID